MILVASCIMILSKGLVLYYLEKGKYAEIHGS